MTWQPGLRRCLRASLLASVLLVLTKALQWSIIDLVTGFLLDPFLALLWLFLSATTVWGVVVLVRNAKLTGWRAASPLLVCLAGVACALFVPFTSIWLNANYHLLRHSRIQVVRRVQEGSLRPNVSYNQSLISLGLLSPPVSTGGNEIVVERHDGQPYVFFFTYRGVLDNFSGYLFVPTGGDPRKFSDLVDTASTQVERVESNWYFAAHR